jgi:hypothetical protein
MRTPCVDCAYRPGSPEDDPDSERPDSAEHPFFCHHGMHRIDDGDGDVGYVPAAWAGGLPLGYMVCAGWWDSVVEGGPAPERQFRDPGGSNRAPAAPAEEPAGHEFTVTSGPGGYGWHCATCVWTGINVGSETAARQEHARVAADIAAGRLAGAPAVETSAEETGHHG